MPATRQLKSFTVKNQDGQDVTIQRRCAGDGKLVQKQLERMVYDEKTEKFRAPHKMSAKAQAKLDEAEAEKTIKTARLEAQVGVTFKPEALVGTAVLSEAEKARQAKHKKAKV